MQLPSFSLHEVSSFSIDAAEASVTRLSLRGLSQLVGSRFFCLVLETLPWSTMISVQPLRFGKPVEPLPLDKKSQFLSYLEPLRSVWQTIWELICGECSPPSLGRDWHSIFQCTGTWNAGPVASPARIDLHRALVPLHDADP